MENNQFSTVSEPNDNASVQSDGECASNHCDEANELEKRKARIAEIIKLLNEIDDVDYGWLSTLPYRPTGE